MAGKYPSDTPRPGIIVGESLYSPLRDFAAAGYSRVMQVLPKRSDAQGADEFGQVLHFPNRRAVIRPFPEPAARPAEIEPADELSHYEREREEPVDYRKRMLMNTIAVVIVTFLVGAGVWIADTIAEMQKDQDCVFQGRSNCAPIEASALHRK